MVAIILYFKVDKNIKHNLTADHFNTLRLKLESHGLLFSTDASTADFSLRSIIAGKTKYTLWRRQCHV